LSWVAASFGIFQREPLSYGSCVKVERKQPIIFQSAGEI
jgi:hypothetical protein